MAEEPRRQLGREVLALHKLLQLLQQLLVRLRHGVLLHHVVEQRAEDVALQPHRDHLQRGRQRGRGPARRRGRRARAADFGRGRGVRAALRPLRADPSALHCGVGGRDEAPRRAGAAAAAAGGGGAP